MIRISQIKLDVFNNNLKKKISHIIHVNENEISNLQILKKSLDARMKPKLFYVYDVVCEIKNEQNILKRNLPNVSFYEEENFEFKITGKIKLKSKVVIVGAGPAGLFCAYMLAKNGYKPLLIEQGQCIEKRVEIVNKFLETGIIDEQCNIQFGEGGAGTFSDGKLNTLAKDKLHIQKEILKIFVECGAPKEILYLNKPHIGTDILRKVIINLRNKIINYGGQVLFNTKLTNILIKENKVVGIEVTDSDVIDTEVLVLAIGHSARQTFYKLHELNFEMQSKPFAVGLRVLHNQEVINMSQYGSLDDRLPSADYKLTYNCNGRGIYSFCMCPGGFVVNSSSEKDGLVINGMSNYKRDSKVSNSAIIVTVNENDYGSDLFAGVKYQEKLEKDFYNLLNGKIPVQLYKDFKNNKCSNNYGSVKPMVLGEIGFANINEAFPKNLADCFIEGMEYFGTKIKGFNNDDTLLMGIESRTSSPIRIIRDEFMVSNILNVYPCGEGAGYAGGIMTSAVDGVKVSLAIASKFIN